MSQKEQPMFRNVLFLLAFLAAIFAVIYVSFWTGEGSVSRKPMPPDGGVPARDDR